MQQNKRNWNLQPSKRAQVPLNPIRNWVENVVPETEKIADPGRPEKKIVFLMGDPTVYPNFHTPEQYKDRAAQAVGKIDGYTAFTGDVKVRAELATVLSSQDWQLTEDDIVLTSAGSQALFYSTIALAQSGDRILMPRPTFPLMKAFCDFFGIEVIFYDLAPGTWQPNIIELEQIFKQYNNIKFIMINSPSNPMGSVLSEQSIQELMAVCERHGNIPIVSDEIYEHMTFGDSFKYLSQYTQTVPILRCSGLTKRCLVPGWRIGWIAMFGKGDKFDQVKQAIKQAANIQLMPNTICQEAMIDVYQMSFKIIPEKMIELEKHYNALHHQLHDAYGLSVGETRGAMYATILVNPEEFKDINNSVEFAKMLQKEENVLVFPGELFYGGNFVRLVICCDIPQIEEACTRIKRFTLRHKK